MKRLCNLLFELSNEDRLKILLQLEEKTMNVTNLAKKLKLTMQEASRHVSRLDKTGVIKKNLNGQYSLTSYGKLILTQLPELEFISKHRGYFTSHSVTHLPSEFVSRIGELQKCMFTDDVMVTFSRMKRVIEESEESIWAIIDQYPMSIVSSARDAVKRNVRFESIEPEDWDPPPEFYQEVVKIERSWASQAMKDKLFEPRMLEWEVNVFLYMSEKEVAALSFPTLSGKFDYKGFFATDERARKWCRDLFQHYWEKAKPKNRFTK